MKNNAIFILITLLSLSSCYRKCEDQDLNIQNFTPRKVFLGQDKPKLKVTVFGPGLISSPGAESNVVFNAKGDQAAYVKYAQHANESYLITMHMKKDKTWSKEVFNHASGKNDKDPFLSPTGDTLYFSSNRSEQGDFDIYFSIRDQESNWSEPLKVDGINTANNEFNPVVTQNNHLYFLRLTNDTLGGIFLSDDEGVKKIQTPFSTSFLHSFSIDYFERVMFVSAYEQGFGLDLNISFFEDGKWIAKERCNDFINSKFNDYAPFIDYAGMYFFFTSDRWSDILEVTKNSDTQLYVEQFDKVQNGNPDAYWMLMKNVLKFYKRQAL